MTYSFTPDELAKIAYLGTLDPGVYDPVLRPGGLDGEGYKINWTLGMNAFADVANAVERLATGAGYALTANTAANITFTPGGYNSVPLNTLSPFVTGHPVRFTFLENVGVWASGVVVGVDGYYIHVRIDHTSADDGPVSGTGWSVMLAPPIMVGATTLKNGIPGMCDTPLIADRRKYWRGDATWGNPPDLAAVGSVSINAGPPPSGYLPCDGNIYLSSAYPYLSEVMPKVQAGDELVFHNTPNMDGGTQFFGSSTKNGKLMVAGYHGEARASTSYDGGATWVAVLSPSSSPVFSLEGGDGDRFAASTNQSLSFRTTGNAGASWETRTITGITAFQVRSCVFTSAVMFAGGASGQMARSADGGATWATAQTGVPSGFPVNKIMHITADTFVALSGTSASGVIRTTTSNWAAIATAGNGPFTSGYVSGSTGDLVVVWNTDGNYYAISKDQGQNFVRRTSPDEKNVRAVYARLSRIVVVTNSDYWISDDDGASWYKRTVALQSYLAQASGVIPIASGFYLFGAGTQNLWKSTADPTRFIVPLIASIGNATFKYFVRYERPDI